MSENQIYPVPKYISSAAHIDNDTYLEMYRHLVQVVHEELYICLSAGRLLRLQVAQCRYKREPRFH